VLRRPCHRVELHHLPTGEIIAWAHTEESLARHLSRAEDIAEEASAADQRMRDGLPADRYDEAFPPRPGPFCAWCDYRRHCPEGAEAAPPRRPWDGLPAD
jgi:putative RecB family exonuclease